ncbi:MAG: hypothetical protein UV73_C0019G0003 [Candidatus Gottesmanbacteria bacterium GW2011_GWA2_43_14]|uniref:Uncharacterized protein n=1 Tax=Candidatus Gottesmanbacteria bacterium GW2011_GWA2_43_14 TaxID=1618443 RepID=A0A0G1FJP3_9BACT|nr:MAG: hypothetical protein UV73_C0019G0003 [Candidatus Gottesmanbacteria bacterium GW2011_GWA2_43_14]
MELNDVATITPTTRILASVWLVKKSFLTK